MLSGPSPVGLISGKLGDFHQWERPCSRAFEQRKPIAAASDPAGSRTQICSMVASGSSKMGMPLRMG